MKKSFSSQSPSIMECSPTNDTSCSYRKSYTNVAVPVNYGMLSYHVRIVKNTVAVMSQSPSIMECSPTLTVMPLLTATSLSQSRQLWNALLQQNELVQYLAVRRSPHQLWNALLLTSASDHRIELSQSPSIMECSPTFQIHH